MDVIEIKAYLPARDFELSIQFYNDLGFNVELLGTEMAYLHIGTSSFLLQNFYVKEHAENFMMHMLVEHVDEWWQKVIAQKLVERYGVMAIAPEDQPWGIRDFVLNDPTGVLWRIGQVIHCDKNE
ncbi:MAG: VOC family protein [Moraxellaceae bacterium]|nr:VOC family protein [Moraxellaceae bacterium]